MELVKECQLLGFVPINARERAVSANGMLQQPVIKKWFIIVITDWENANLLKDLFAYGHIANSHFPDGKK